MLSTSFSTRGALFAFLIGPPRTLSRREGMAIHDAVCQRLGEDDFSFQYGAGEAVTPGGESKPFHIVVERPQGRSRFRVMVDNKGPQAPVRIFVDSPWPRSRETAFEDIDLAVEAVFEALGEGWSIVMAETRLRGQVESKDSTGARYLTKEVLHLSEGELGTLGLEPSFAGVRLETPPGAPSEDDPLADPKHEISLEVLRENPKSLYIELMSQWPQLPPFATPSGGTLEVDPRRIRSFDHSPSDYLRHSMAYLNSVVLPLFTRP